MADIFVSYASEDRDRVEPLVEALQACGWDVWWDRELIVGPSFDEKIEEAIDAASCIVVVWSAHSIKSQWVRAEANEGMTRKVLVPLLVDDVRPPLAFRVAQTARLTGWPDQRGEFDALVAGITALLGEEPPVKPTPAKANDSKSIAVLPFVNMSNDPEQEYFSDGISEELINALVRVPQLVVTARTSSFRFKGESRDMREIGRRLGVNHLLEGSVRKAGNRIRVTAQLISVSSGHYLWSDRFDRELTDIFEVQDEITAEIVNALHGTLAGTNVQIRRTTSVEAYNAYLLGLHHQNRNQFSKAIDAYRMAIAHDASCAEAYVGLVLAFGFQNIYMPGSVDQETIEDCIAQALELDPDNPSLVTARLTDLFYKEHQYQRAIDELSAVLDRHPNDVGVMRRMAAFCTAMGKQDQAIALAMQAARIDPLAASHYASLGDYLARKGKHADAAAAFAQSEALGGNAMAQRALAAILSDDIDELGRLLDLGENSWGSGASFYLVTRLIYLRLTHADEALTELVQSIAPDADNLRPMAWALVAAARGDVDAALLAYSRALEAGDFYAVRLASPDLAEPTLSGFAEFYYHPGFAESLVRFGLDPDSLARITIPPLPFSDRA